MVGYRGAAASRIELRRRLVTPARIEDTPCSGIEIVDNTATSSLVLSGLGAGFQFQQRKALPVRYMVFGISGITIFAFDSAMIGSGGVPSP